MRGCITAVIASLAFSLLAPVAWGQTEVDQVSFGYNNSWDGLVWIRRGSDGELYFTDTVAGTSISLEGLTTSPDSGITTTAADSRYVNVTGDETMTGDLTLTGTTPPQVYINSSSNAWFRAKSGATANAELNLLNGSSGWSWISNGTDGKLYLYNEDNTVNFVEIDNSTGDIRFNTIGGGTAIWELDSGTGQTSQTGALLVGDGGATVTAAGEVRHPMWSPGLTSVSTATSLTASSAFVAYVVTAAVSIELPNPTTCNNGRTFRIKATHASGATVTTHNADNDIDGVTAEHALAQYEACEFQTDGTNWYRMNDYD